MTDSPLAALLDLVWPVTCAGCRRPGAALCRPCARPLRERTGRVAALAGTTAVGAPPTWATAEYSGGVREALVAFKDHDRADLRRWLVPALAEAVQAALEQSAVLAGLAEPAGTAARGPSAVVLVPVPSRRAAVRRRGRDVVADLARATAVLLSRRGTPALVVPALAQGRGLRDQAGLDAAARTGNLAGGLTAAGSAARTALLRAQGGGARVVLVDDVVTTGATLAEARRVLTGMGAPVCAAAAVAATPRRGRDVAGQTGDDDGASPGDPPLVRLRG